MHERFPPGMLQFDALSAIFATEVTNDGIT